MRLTEIQNLLGEKWFSNLLGIIGGSLGIVTFVDTYLLRFKPRIYIGSHVFFTLIDDEKHNRKDLKSVILAIEVCNHRKKHGSIYDVALRVYQAKQINPQATTFYASEIATDLIVEDNKIEPRELKPFSPIAILPSSNKSINVLVGEIAYSRPSINPSADYYIEMFYQTKPGKKWKFIDKLRLYNVTKDTIDSGQDSQSKDDNFIAFTSVDYFSIRGNLPYFSKAATSVTEGAFQRERKLAIHRIRQAALIPVFAVKSVVEEVAIKSKLIFNKAIDWKFRLPVVERYAVERPKNKITVGNAKLRPFAKSAIHTLFTELSILAESLNKKAKDKNYHITLKQGQSDDFTISCYHRRLRVHRNGDTRIKVEEDDATYGSKVTFNFDLRENFLGRQHWYLEHEGYLSVKSFALRIVDFLLLHSHSN